MANIASQVRDVLCNHITASGWHGVSCKTSLFVSSPTPVGKPLLVLSRFDPAGSIEADPALLFGPSGHRGDVGSDPAQLFIDCLAPQFQILWFGSIARHGHSHYL